MSGDPSTGDGPVVGVYRSAFLPRSETFVRDHLLRMPRYKTVPVTSQLVDDPLPVPGKEPVLARPRTLLPRAAASVLRRAGRDRPSHDVALADAFRRSGADLVHAHFGVDAARAMTAARWCRLPLVPTFHGYDVTMHPEVLRGNPDSAWMVDNWDRLVGQAAAVVTVSRFLRGVLLERGVPPEKVHVIACGVDSSTFTPAPLPESPSLLFVGRLVEKKGVGDLLHALAGLDAPPPLQVIGDGPLREALQREAEELRLRCTFTGTATTQQIKEAMASCTAVVMPSRRASSGDSEGLGVTALEAAASARPLVGYAHGGLSEAVSDEVTGLLAPEGDVAGLRERIARVVAEPELARTLGGSARERVAREFDADALLGRLADVYDAVLRR